jgi:hypothetical protein
MLNSHNVYYLGFRFLSVVPLRGRALARVNCCVDHRIHAVLSKLKVLLVSKFDYFHPGLWSTRTQYSVS